MASIQSTASFSHLVCGFTGLLYADVQFIVLPDYTQHGFDLNLGLRFRKSSPLQVLAIGCGKEYSIIISLTSCVGSISGDAMVSTWMWKPEWQAEAPLASLKAAKKVIANNDYEYACAA